MLKNEQALEDFAERVARAIVNAQDNGIPQVFFDQLPEKILEDLEELKYPIKHEGSKYCIKVL